MTNADLFWADAALTRLYVMGKGFERYHGIPSDFRDWARHLAAADPTVYRMVPIWTPLSFDKFCAFANRQPIVDLDDTFFTSDDEWRDRLKHKGRFGSDVDTIERIPRGFDHNDLAWSERSYFGTCVNILHPEGGSIRPSYEEGRPLLPAARAGVAMSRPTYASAYEGSTEN